MEWKLSKQCKHNETRTYRWVENDGTLMLHKTCLECGVTLDKGYVYGEDDGTWTGVFVEHNETATPTH